MIGYVFWHRAAAGVSPEEYEGATSRFHRSLAAEPPGGFVASVCFRVEALAWLEGEGVGYEDWYVVEDFADLGVLNEAAVGRGHATSHNAAARLSTHGTGGIYRLLDGVARFEHVRMATWITPARGRHTPALEDFLADGIDPARAILWRRQLALGPAPGLCLLTHGLAAGVSAARLPADWHGETAGRSAI